MRHDIRRPCAESGHILTPDTKSHGLALRYLVGIAVASLIAAFPPVDMSQAQTQRSAVVVEVTGVRSERGHIQVALCTPDTFPGADCPLHASAPALAGTTTVRFAAVPPGTYAVEAFHDDDDTGKMTFSLLGIPAKGMGSSGGEAPRFGPPRFADAAVLVTPGPVRITAPLRYF